MVYVNNYGCKTSIF